MHLIVSVIEALVVSACSVAAGWRLLHYFQLESYQLPGYKRSVRRNAMRAALPPVATAALGVSCVRLGVPALIRLALVALLAALMF